MFILFTTLSPGVHENPRIGSDGESEEMSATSDDREVTSHVSPVKLRPNRPRRTLDVSIIILE